MSPLRYVRVQVCTYHIFGLLAERTRPRIVPDFTPPIAMYASARPVALIRVKVLGWIEQYQSRSFPGSCRHSTPAYPAAVAVVAVSPPRYPATNESDLSSNTFPRLVECKVALHSKSQLYAIDRFYQISVDLSRFTHFPE